jgi:hypothetical protein
MTMRKKLGIILSSAGAVALLVSCFAAYGFYQVTGLMWAFNPDLTNLYLAYGAVGLSFLAMVTGLILLLRSRPREQGSPEPM